MSSASGSVSKDLSRLKKRDLAAAQPIWEKYMERLIRLARKKLRTVPQLRSYEEDVVVSAFESFFRAVERERFPQLDDRDDLWQILAMLVGRKAHRAIQRALSKPPVLTIGDLLSRDGPEAAAILGMISKEPDPKDAAAMVEVCNRLLEKLGAEQLQQIAIWKLEGYTHEEIRELLGYDSVKTVERKVRIIRMIWEKEFRT